MHYRDKAGMSSLNPYAASYVPLSKRGQEGETKDFKDVESKVANEVICGSQPDIYNVTSVYPHQTADTTKLNAHPVYGYSGSSSHHAYELTEKQIADEVFDVDMSYLQMEYPGISDESLSDVYWVNQGDLDATVDMLNQLVQPNSDSTEKLPDSLDIGDVSETVSSTEFESSKLKKVIGEAGPSSSHSS